MQNLAIKLAVAASNTNTKITSIDPKTTVTLTEAKAPSVILAKAGLQAVKTLE